MRTHCPFDRPPCMKTEAHPNLELLFAWENEESLQLKWRITTLKMKNNNCLSEVFGIITVTSVLIHIPAADARKCTLTSRLTHSHPHPRIHTHTYTHTYTHAHTYTHTLMHPHTLTHIHSRTHTYTHTYTHTHTPTYTWCRPTDGTIRSDSYRSRSALAQPCISWFPCCDWFQQRSIGEKRERERSWEKFKGTTGDAGNNGSDTMILKAIKLWRGGEWRKGRNSITSQWIHTCLLVNIEEVKKSIYIGPVHAHAHVTQHDLEVPLGQVTLARRVILRRIKKRRKS